MREMLVEAYCFEDDTIENAKFARNRLLGLASPDHWFCRVCQVPVMPKISSRQNGFFSAFKNKPHLPSCPHVTDETHDGHGIPSYTKSPPPPPVFPNVLGTAPPRTRKTYNPAEKIDLTQLIASAPQAKAYGTLEQVVDAWMQMSPAERAAHPLQVGTYDAMYEKVFLNLFAGSALPKAAYWTNRIYCTEVIIKSGITEDNYFLNSRYKFAAGESKIPLTFRIKLDRDLVNLKPAMQGLLKSGQKATLFWNGEAPEVVAKGNFTSHALKLGTSANAEEFAVRNL